MKTKAKLLASLLALVGVTALSNMLIANNNTQSLNSNYDVNTNKFDNLQISKKEFDAKLIGGYSGTFTIEYKDVNHCKITKISKKFTAYGHFNFNGGYFTKDGITYTITEIGSDAFSSTFTKHFHYCNLTIPSTIKKIGNSAFFDCAQIKGDKEIIAINFEEGVEEIGESAFDGCYDIKNKSIKLPNSLKKVGERAFQEIHSARIIDLTSLDHLIEASAIVKNYEVGCIPSNVEKIYVKNNEIKNKYCADFC